MKQLLNIVVILGTLALPLLTTADVPQLINYQGRLTDSEGTPMSGSFAIIFKICNDSLGSLCAWTETHNAVEVNEGLFQVVLGGTTPIEPDLFSGEERWLGLHVGAEDLPYSRLLSVPYAHHAAQADTAAFASFSAGGSGWVDDGAAVCLETSSDWVGVGTASPTHRMHITGNESNPLLYIEKTGSGRGLKVRTVSACAIWVENAGNHGLRVSYAGGNGINVTAAGGYGGWFNGDGYFNGDLTVTGTVYEGGGVSRIDHPLDPQNKFLSHSYVDSPDMMSVYNGNIETDEDGLAVVELPDYFSALNQDFRYQLTVLGQFAQAIIAEKISGNQFTIRTDRPSVEVSWQVTGIRKDAWAEAHRVPVEVDKPVDERGLYLHPEAFGHGSDPSINALYLRRDAEAEENR